MMKDMEVFKVRVQLGAVAGGKVEETYRDYEILAGRDIDAQVIAYAIDGGYDDHTLTIGPSDVGEALMWTEIVE